MHKHGTKHEGRCTHLPDRCQSCCFGGMMREYLRCWSPNHSFFRDAQTFVFFLFFLFSFFPINNAAFFLYNAESISCLTIFILFFFLPRNLSRLLQWLQDNYMFLNIKKMTALFYLEHLNVEGKIAILVYRFGR